MLGIAMGCLLESLCATRKGDHAGPVGGKAAGKSPADPPAGAGDENDFSLQDHGNATSHVCADDCLETNGVCNSPRLQQAERYGSAVPGSGSDAGAKAGGSQGQGFDND